MAVVTCGAFEAAVWLLFLGLYESLFSIWDTGRRGYK